MRYPALACDYDGTIATHGVVDPPTVQALEKFAASGRRLLLVTGRELPELISVFPELHLFRLVVAENGAMLYRPSDGHIELLAQPPSEEFVSTLRMRGVDRISVGKTIVATWEPFEVTVFETIRDLGLELQVIFNKGAVMVLPAGVNKATGLKAALRELGLSLHDVVGVGDAENDHAFLSVCECSAAVANALPSLKERADLVTAGDHGAGVAELIDHILANDLANFDDRLTRHDLTIGLGEDGTEFRVNPGTTRLVAVQHTARGVPAAAARLIERLATASYQVVILSSRKHGLLPKHSIAVGSPDRPPTVEELLKTAESPRNNPTVDLESLPAEARTEFVSSALAGLAALRRRKGRPHWIVLFEPHGLLPKGKTELAQSLEWPGDRCLVISTSPLGLPPIAGGRTLTLATDAKWLEGLTGQSLPTSAAVSHDETWLLRDGAVSRIITAAAKTPVQTTSR